VRLATGGGASAVAWALDAAWDGPVDPAELPDLFRFGVPAVEAAGVTPARILVAAGRATGDDALLDRAYRHLETAGRLAAERGLGWLRLRVAILRALLADAQGNRRLALESLAAAVADAEPEGVVRPFLDEGEPMAALLADLRGGASPTSLVEPLTERELDVLRLLAAGRSNAGIAADLFVELSTVKTHLIHLYGKLGVHSRTQAVARARALRLLD